MKGENTIVGFTFLAILAGLLFGVYRLFFYLKTFNWTQALETAVISLAIIASLLCFLLICKTIGKSINKKLEKIGNSRS